MGKAYNKLRSKKTHAVTKATVPELVYKAYSKGCTKENRISGFSKTGIYPFQPEHTSLATTSPQEPSLQRYLTHQGEKPRVEEILDIIRFRLPKEVRSKSEVSTSYTFSQQAIIWATEGVEDGSRTPLLLSIVDQWKETALRLITERHMHEEGEQHLRGQHRDERGHNPDNVEKDLRHIPGDPPYTFEPQSNIDGKPKFSKKLTKAQPLTRHNIIVVNREKREREDKEEEQRKRLKQRETLAGKENVSPAISLQKVLSSTTPNPSKRSQAATSRWQRYREQLSQIAAANSHPNTSLAPGTPATLCTPSSLRQPLELNHDHSRVNLDYAETSRIVQLPR